VLKMILALAVKASRAIGLASTLVGVSASCAVEVMAETTYRTERIKAGRVYQAVGGLYESPQAAFAAYASWRMGPQGCPHPLECEVYDLRPCADPWPENQYGYDWGEPHEWCHSEHITYAGKPHSSGTGNAVHMSALECPSGWERHNWAPLSGRGGGGEPYIFERQCIRTVPDRQVEPNSCNGRGNPIFPEDATKRAVEVDYVSADGWLRFARHYRSDRGTFEHDYQSVLFTPERTSRSGACLSALGRTLDPATGNYTFIPYCFPYLNSSDAGDQLQIRRSEGGAVDRFVWDGADATPMRAYNKDAVTRQSVGGVVQWTVRRALNDQVETYDQEGHLVSIAARDGKRLFLSYSDGQTPPSVAPGPGHLIRIADHLGRTLELAWDSIGRLALLKDPSGGQITYGYEPVPTEQPCTTAPCYRLASVTYPDGSVRRYHWDEREHAVDSSVTVGLLTGVTDENGTRYATWKYEKTRAVSTERAGGVERYRFDHVQPHVSARVTDPLGVPRTYSFADAQGITRLQSVTGAPCAEKSPQAQTFDANGNVASRRDWNGNLTCYTYDLTRNLEIVRAEGLKGACPASLATWTPAPGSEQRKITTEWHPFYRLPVRLAEPLRITTYTYGEPTASKAGNRGSLLTKKVRRTRDADGSLGLAASTTGSAQIWRYTYNTNGQVLTVDGPRTDVADVTTYTYYANNASCAGASPIGCRGQVRTVQNALGHVSTVAEYNAHGQPLRVIDPNGLVTRLTYDARQRLTSRTVGRETTSYTYDTAGELTRVVLPDGSFLAYSYDPARRLVGLADNLGNRIAYTLDVKGNRVREEVYDPSNALAQTRQRVYNALNRLVQEIGAAGQTTTYGYDEQGNVTSVAGPLPGALTTHAYDALNRLTRTTDPAGGEVQYGYNARDKLTSVTDPRQIVTSYTYNGRDDLTEQLSRDTGKTTHTYDVAGNVLSTKDARGQVTTYAYDALNRVTSVAHHDGTLHTYVYDEGEHQKGRLTRLIEPHSSTAYAYDLHGRLLTESRTIAGVAYATRYAYDAVGRLIAITYPGGREVAYALDGLGRIQAIATSKSGTTWTVLAAAAYQPFGPVKGFAFGNGQAYARGFDADGRIASYTLANRTLAVGYDTGSRITSINDPATPAHENAYGYDLLDRLTSYVGANVNQSFTYDAVGNRLTKTVGASTGRYEYSATRNRLTRIRGSQARTFTYDATGNVTAAGVHTFAYDARGRMSESVGALGTTTYRVNALGQRIRKTNSLEDTVYHYDREGRLIAESTAGGVIQKEYIYLHDIPVAVVQ
jgi:YD repeat-containing protein